MHQNITFHFGRSGARKDILGATHTGANLFHFQTDLCEGIFGGISDILHFDLNQPNTGWMMTLEVYAGPNTNPCGSRRMVRGFVSGGSANNLRKGDRCQQHCRDCYSSLAPRLLAPFAWCKPRYRSEFVQQMADAEHRVMKQHSRSGITHHRFDALALRFAVAVDLASIAGRFLLVDWTDLKALQGVREQSFAVTTKRALRGMMIATEDPHHGFDRLLFARDTRARQIRARRRCFDCSWHIVQGALSTKLAGQKVSAYINTILNPALRIDAANVSRPSLPRPKRRKTGVQIDIGLFKATATAVAG